MGRGPWSHCARNSDVIDGFKLTPLARNTGKAQTRHNIQEISIHVCTLNAILICGITAIDWVCQ